MEMKASVPDLSFFPQEPLIKETPKASKIMQVITTAGGCPLELESKTYSQRHHPQAEQSSWKHPPFRLALMVLEGVV